MSDQIPETDGRDDPLYHVDAVTRYLIEQHLDRIASVEETSVAGRGVLKSKCKIILIGPRDDR